jgi:hypothetical protein
VESWALIEAVLIRNASYVMSIGSHGVSQSRLEALRRVRNQGMECESLLSFLRGCGWLAHTSGSYGCCAVGLTTRRD